MTVFGNLAQSLPLSLNEKGVSLKAPFFFFYGELPLPPKRTARKCMLPCSNLSLKKILPEQSIILNSIKVKNNHQ